MSNEIPFDRKFILEQAIKTTCNDRVDIYGEPEDSFSIIALFWSIYLGHDIEPNQVASMMALMKIARSITTHHPDNYVDAAAYMALAGELDIRDIK